MKIFYTDCYCFALSYKNYLGIKSLPLKRVLNAQDAFYECTNHPIVYEDLNAYIMSYVEQAIGTSLLDIPTTNLLRDTLLLEEDAKILAANGIK